MEKIGKEILRFSFYLFALFLFFHYPQEYSIYNDSFWIYHLKFIMLVISLPVLYIYQLAYYFNFEDYLPFNQSNTQFQVKLFYYTTNILITIFFILEFADKIFNF